MKLIKQILDAFKVYNAEQKAKQEKRDFQISVNGMMKIAFKSDTKTAIELQTEFNKRFESEIAKRGLDAQIEAIDCEDYFNKIKKSLQYGN
ncbi:hypothetical protein snork62_gp029 [Flavobacterium phage vB_FspS_snork6-2]|uniref:Uncharacterized protein n=8 Tax=Lillamyvirus TaxID=2843418 RepID=A0A6B9LMD6_9CAUD|nr:hypothetical protein HWC89_gp28 [Flavobacterium phage vB_FspS_hemulen6-1]YP_009855168.1 hypothetical protein HWC95_gp32 [Flavobacterium phage vB_FspS_sniff9-1]YP_009855241.1 hypothetical protein HWC96_gp31 [Flavobacterium phage vB_FspS_snork6-1]YP_009855380.1 hypothetical protein HWC98_gp25 [Flavobacterium phage vB_FspS_stinky9-1]QHB38859.1 hypothetical protein hemulen62_gp028 [Flavobacterium phage vB_FspS_hemulen6-2]QHB38929.1 hypothetical protein hemulen91_gp028 [Flavobacterium phage vB_F